MREQPRIDVSFRTTPSTDQTVSEILNGVADVGFASLPVFSPALKVTSLFEDELVLVVGHGHRFAGRDQVSLDEVRKERRRGARRPVAFAQMVHDAPHHRGVGNEADDSHLGSAARTHQWVHFVHPPDEIGPATPQRRPLGRWRERLLDFTRAVPLELSLCLAA